MHIEQQDLQIIIESPLEKLAANKGGDENPLAPVENELEEAKIKKGDSQDMAITKSEFEWIK